ncbi:GNAT family N-acetyltransferase [Curtobacterium sp. RRHDQ10]|uniref:GNAT family N-acetyltransferase n=1 Tax=Curtobacterium phyllosphaerae TaxID=3413379 RepID=UPI003BF0A2D0
MGEHSVRCARWTDLDRDDLWGIVRLRNRVFALEQRVTDEDFEPRDQADDTEHWWIDGAGGVAAAYLRLIRPSAAEVSPDGAEPARWVVGRVATEVGHRRRGFAHRLVEAVLDAHGTDPIALHAQEHVAGLYAASGFVRFGASYVEAGIRHVGMYRAPGPR